VKYYYLFKEYKSHKDNEQVKDLRLWSLSKDIVNTIYQKDTDFSDDLQKILGKIEYLCI